MRGHYGIENVANFTLLPPMNHERIYRYPIDADPYFFSQSRLKEDDAGIFRWSGRHFFEPTCEHQIIAYPRGYFDPVLVKRNFTHEIVLGVRLPKMGEDGKTYRPIYRTQRCLIVPGIDEKAVCSEILIMLIQAIGETSRLDHLLYPDDDDTINNRWSHVISSTYKRILKNRLKDIGVSTHSYICVPTLFNHLFQDK